MRAIETSADDRGLIAALAAEGLPTDDLAAEGRQFFSFYTDDGVLIGYGGVEVLGNGAARPDEIAAWLRQAGFVDVRIEEKAESRDLIRDWARDGVSRILSFPP